MPFIDELNKLAAEFARKHPDVSSEDGAKLAFVQPVFRLLGYNPNEPTEVSPEHTSGLGADQGPKVDYALLKDGKTVILVECKKMGASLDGKEVTQLSKYFTPATDAPIGILTDGLRWRFFSDLNEPNIMDGTPFFEFTMEGFSPEQGVQLEQFSRCKFNAASIRKIAVRLMDIAKLRKVLEGEYAHPSAGLINHFIAKSDIPKTHGKGAPGQRKYLAPLIQEAFTQLIAENQPLTTPASPSEEPIAQTP